MNLFVAEYLRDVDFVMIDWLIDFFAFVWKEIESVIGFYVIYLYVGVAI